MKKCFAKMFISSLIVVLILGCSGISSDSALQIEQKKNNYSSSNLSQCKNAEEAGQVMADSVINGLDSGNYEMYVRDFTDESKKSFTDKIFQDAHKAVDANLGKIKTRQYLGSYQKNEYSVLLWKAKYSKSNEDILLELYVKKVENSYKVAAFIPK